MTKMQIALFEVTISGEGGEWGGLCQQDVLTVESARWHAETAHSLLSFIRLYTAYNK